VKKTLLSVPVLLALGVAAATADELTSAPAFIFTGPPAYLQWSGPYVGLNGGYGWSNTSVNYTPNDPASAAGTIGGIGRGQAVPSTSFATDGALFGGQVGFNWQVTSLWLVGLEGDYQWSNFKGTGFSSFTLGNVGATTIAGSETVKSFGTVRARIGVMPVGGPLLLYGTAGLAVGQVSNNFTIANPLLAGAGSVSSGGFSYLCTAGGPPCFAGSTSKTNWGWVAGAGAEYAMTTNLTLKVELLYMNLGVPSATLVAQNVVAGTAPASFTPGLSSIGIVFMRGGVNFRF
jgi:outer membrane immunogenic protein